MADQEWYTLDELATIIGTTYNKVRNTVQVLSKTKQIVTRDRPGDNRILEIHKDSVELIKQATL